MSKFVTQTRPVYEKLVEIRDQFTKADLHDPEDSLKWIADLEEAERQVLLAWANSTRDINPCMLGDVEAGRMKWYPALDEYLNRMFYSKEG